MKKQKTENLKMNKGITLIALVITIIVMLILVAVTISMAVNGGLFEYASNAGTQTNAEVDAEQELAGGKIKIGNTWYDSPQDYVEGTPTGTPKPYDKTEMKNGLLTANATFASDGLTAVIPKGFKIVNGLEGTQSIAAGLVIQDALGNEFVWIPVQYTASGTKDEKGLDTGFLAAFKRSNIDDTNYSEPCASGYSDRKGTQEKADYYDMMKSVQDNFGFYVGRYEAGTTEERKEDFDNGTDTLVVKRDVMPYNYVAWGKDMIDYTSIIKYDSIYDEYSETGKDYGKGAVLLSKELYGKTEDVKKYGVKSTLCYGVQWDAMLKFMGKDTETDSSNWGNYSYNPLIITRASAKYYKNGQWKPVSETPCGQLLTTGADNSFAVKNIFDVAGNCWEWTMESYFDYARSARGAGYSNIGALTPVSERNTVYPYECNYNLYSFRPVLYIKNN